MDICSETIKRIERIITDDVVSLEELESLANFLNDNREARHSWPGNAIFEVLQDILSDGKVEQHELAGLALILSGITIIGKGRQGNNRDSNSKRMNILVAEDKETDRELLGRAFKRVRRQVDLNFVTDGMELLDAVRNRSSSAMPDLILLDLGLPRMDGKEVLRQLPKIPGAGKIPVVVLTGSKSDEDLLESFKLGVHSYLEKPIGTSGWNQLVTKLEEFWVVA